MTYENNDPLLYAELCKHIEARHQSSLGAFLFENRTRDIYPRVSSVLARRSSLSPRLIPSADDNSPNIFIPDTLPVTPEAPLVTKSSFLHDSSMLNSKSHRSFLPCHVRFIELRSEVFQATPIKPVGEKPVYPGKYWMIAIPSPNCLPPKLCTREVNSYVWGVERHRDWTTSVLLGEINPDSPAYQKPEPLPYKGHIRRIAISQMVETIISVNPGSNAEISKKLFNLNVGHASTVFDAWQKDHHTNLGPVYLTHAIDQFDIIKPEPLDGERLGYRLFIKKILNNLQVNHPELIKTWIKSRK